MASAPPLTVTRTPRAVADGVFLSEGLLSLPNGLRLAFKMWSNKLEINSPIEKAAVAPTAAAATAASTSSTPAPAAADDRFNILALPSDGTSLCNASSFDALAPAVLHALSPRSLAAPPRCIVFLALEYAGTGLSQCRPRDGNYALTHDVADVMLMLSRVLRWSECAIVGHGVGARIVALLAASDALRIPPPAAAAALPRPTRLLGCALLDPFPYQSWSLEKGRDEDYAAVMPLQSDPDALKRSVPVRERLQRTRKTMFKSFDQAVAAHLESDRDGEVSEASARVLLSRGLKLVKRPLQPPAPEVLASLAGAMEDERELILPAPAAASSSSSATAAAAPSMPAPMPVRDFDPRTEEVGWVCRSDPLRAEAPMLLGFSRASISAALSTLRCRALMVHARTQASSSDLAFLRHIDLLVHGSSGESASHGVFSLPHGAGLGTQRDIVGDHHAHLDPDSREEVLPIVTEFLRDCWNDRVNTRKDRSMQEQIAARQAKEARQLIMQAERRFLHEKPGSQLGPLAESGLVSRL